MARTAAPKEEETVEVTNNTIICYSRNDIAAIMGISGQALFNRIRRDPDFPPPTYSNRAGNTFLYSEQDLERIVDYMQKADRERIARMQEALAKHKEGKGA